MQAISIKQSTDLNTITTDDLMGNLQTFELEMEEEDRYLNKDNKGVAFDATVPARADSDTEMNDVMVMLSKKFGKNAKES